MEQHVLTSFFDILLCLNGFTFPCFIIDLWLADTFISIQSNTKYQNLRLDLVGTWCAVGNWCAGVGVKEFQDGQCGVSTSSYELDLELEWGGILGGLKVVLGISSWFGGVTITC